MNIYPSIWQQLAAMEEKCEKEKAEKEKAEKEKENKN